MRRAAILGFISMLAALAGAAYAAGVFSIRLSLENALGVEADDLAEIIGEHVNQEFATAVAWQFMAGTAVMLMGTLLAVLCARAIFQVQQIRNPWLTMRGPLVVIGIGLAAVFMWAFTFPALLVGLVWLAVKVMDECGPRGDQGRLAQAMGLPTTGGPGSGGDLSDIY